ncbi:alpha/beta hydrolase [Oricola nitratireducens]|uniref:alpha/beta hydrolase n=1 Tax=Oricola nitratireducens TaxID=2775868 RepID=UPI0018694447|nr:alpha/beta hydrolase [Oricola nitratireducens]
MSALAFHEARGEPIRRILFVHGRAQGGRNVADIRREWIKALKEGASAAGMALPDDLNIALPFYGDELDRLTAEFDLPLAADVTARGTAEQDAFLAFQAEVAQDLRIKAGVTDAEVDDAYGDNPRPKGPLNWEWVQAIFRAIDSHSDGITSDALQIALRDVYVYNSSPAVRRIINGIVSREIDDRPTVIIAHSLGSVVAYYILRELTAPKVPLLVTLGSPLGIRAIRRPLKPLHHPAVVQAWLNGYDNRDVVALYPLDADNFDIDPAIENIATLRNQTENRHGIIGYLDKPKIAGRIIEALN